MNTSSSSFRSRLLLAASVIATLAAQANTVTYTDALSIGPVDFASSLVVPKFDASLGTLVSVSYTLTGNLTANQKFENLGGGTPTISVTSTGTMTLKKPDLSVLVITVPTVVNSRSVAAFDNTVDFGGASGFTFDPTSVSLANTGSTSAPADLADFTGIGNITLPVTAVGNSSGSGAASLAVVATLAGSASLSLTYNYNPIVNAVPEASTYGSIGAVAIIGAFGYRRSRKPAAQSN